MTKFLSLLFALLPLLSSISKAQWSPSLHVEEPPSFVIAVKGVRHSLAPSYFTIGDWIDPSNANGRTYRCLLEEGPDGMTLSEAGDMEWIPAASKVGIRSPIRIRIQVEKDGGVIYESTRTFTLEVLERIPQISDRPTINTYESNPIGWNVMIFDGFQPSDSDRTKFHWSLINPPPGAYIDGAGGIHWPDDRGYSRDEPYVFKVRIDYQTASGWVYDEAILSQRILPQPATNNFGELRSFNLPPASSGLLGYSIVAGDGWIAAGEPFSGTTPPGRVRLWRLDESNATWYDHIAFQPEFVQGGQSFGASLSLSPANSQQPLRIAVGAPDASKIGSSGETLVSVGAVHVYSLEANGEWKKETSLIPPVIRPSSEFGASVSIEGNTLIAGLPGENTPGYNSGALSIFTLATGSWSLQQTLKADVPAWGDRFGATADLEGEWIAVSAPGDDRVSDNAGAVHLYQRAPGGFVHRQVIHSPSPEPNTRFGERLLLSGPWLFASSFRERENTGTVHVFKDVAGTWILQQSLSSPFANPGSAFGLSLSISSGTLAVSAPGQILGEEIDITTSPWKGITLFKLEGNTWKWSRQVTESPDGTPDSHSWGYSVAQISPDLTVAGIPDYRGYADGQYYPLSGRIFLHRWPAILSDPFLEVLAGLPNINGSPAKADDDSNHNGVPNILDWMMGSDPGAPADGWTSRVPESKQPFIRRNPDNGKTVFMIPQILSGMNRKPVIEVSEDLSTWRTVEDARWGALEEVYFYKENDGNYLTYFHPVTIPTDGDSNEARRFFRWGVHEE